MKQMLVSLFIILFVFSCGVNRDYVCDEIRGPNSIEIAHSSTTTENNATIKGKIFDENGEPLFGATVIIEGVNMGAYVDFDGNFEIKDIPAVTYNVQVKMIGYKTVTYERLELKTGSQIVFKDIILVDESLELKPIIYFYPEDTIALQVTLDYDGELIHTYPESTGNWEMTAYPDGTLIDATGRSYYSIYWEGITEHEKTINTGFIVPRSETIPFLEEKLAYLGLNEREANEFIIFWLQILNQNETNLIHFDTEHYTQHAVLKVYPTPETIFRIMMLYSPVDVDFHIDEQLFPVLTERKGFTVVEWGGQKFNLSQITNP